MSKLTLRYAALAAVPLFVFGEAKPAAICGYGSDVHAIVGDIMKPNRYVYETFTDKWLPPEEFPKYAVVYYGEKVAGEAKGRNWKDEAARSAIERYLDGGGTIVVAGDYCLRQLMGFENAKNPDPLRARIIHRKRLFGRTRIEYGRAGKSLGFADDAGNFVVTPEGREVDALKEDYTAIFASITNLAVHPVEGNWAAVPLGTPGDLKLPRKFPKRAEFHKPEPRGEGLVLLDGKTKAVISLGDCGETVRPLAEELAWHLGKMSGAAFEVDADEPASGPALVYRKASPPEGFARGTASYFKIWREGDKVFLGGEDAGLSRATTYVLEALGCRYIWPGESGKIIPKAERIALPEIAVEDATSFVIRRMRLYGRPEWRDRPENRDFYRWHGLNDTKFMTSEKPNEADAYQWGHYYGDYYKKYYAEHRDWFALQPDGTRNLNLGSHPERPTFCLSNMELARFTADRIKAQFRANPDKKALSICLPDGATSTQCMCEECRKLDPTNAAPGKVTIYFPKRHSVPYVASTDRVFTFMNRVAEFVAEEFPDKLLSCYAYGGYTAPPVKTVPHKNLLILSVAGYYSSYGRGGEVEANLAAWHSFGNRLLWRPNAHAGFNVLSPDNVGRRMFEDISLMDANGLFGVDYDTMSSEWAIKAFMYYMVCRAHYNPDRLDFDTLADDWCRAGFGAGWKHVRKYWDLVETACNKAAAENAAAPSAIDWKGRVERSMRLPRATDYDALDQCLADARAAVGGDAEINARIDRLAFGTRLGRLRMRLAEGGVSEEEKEKARAFIRDYLAHDSTAFPTNHGKLQIK